MKTKTKSKIKKQAKDVASEIEKIAGKTSEKIKNKRLYRSGKDKLLGGVCGGIAEYLEIDPVIVRLFWVLITLAWGFGLLLYLIAWIIIPKNPNHEWK
ncbi:PspC domain-containing protein [Candidatus Micrarchaeota archaeon]|nr:PspC domain-containing protein [Candidatus Micrarchaeota archaeon]